MLRGDEVLAARLRTRPEVALIDIELVRAIQTPPPAAA